MLILENPTGHVAGILETDTWTTEVERGPRGQRVPHGELFEWFSVGEERFYVIWHVQWEAVQGESFELLSDAERKFEQLREVYKALQRSLAVTGLLVDASYRERRFLGVREDGIMKKFREWWQQQQTAAVLARDVGETLLCKAAKAQQWDLVVWMLRSPSERRRVFGPSWGGACHASPGPTIQNPDGLIKQGIKEKDEEIRTGKDRKKQAYCLDQSGRTIDIHLRIQPIRNFMKFRRSARIILATIVRYRKYLNYFEL
ncbi:unnamed protein product [Durusdinium trenchii]|uniref:Uncharacterized protein n=1 Tax=Durusdinium trenchii TaxID=1381693 RepID=A0ABP0KQ21_9DINO